MTLHIATVELNLRWTVITVSLAVSLFLFEVPAYYINEGKNEALQGGIGYLKRKGDSHLRNNEVDSALYNYLTLISRYDEDLPESDKIIYAEALNNTAYIYTLINSDYLQAYRYLLKSLEISEKTGYDALKSNIYLNIGNIYLFFRDPKNAYENYLKAIDWGKATNNIEIVNTSVANITLGMFDTLPKEDILEVTEDYLTYNAQDGKMSEFTRELCFLIRDSILEQTPEDYENRIERLEGLIDSNILANRYVESLRGLKRVFMLKSGHTEEVISQLKGMLETSDLTLGDLTYIYDEIATSYGAINEVDSALMYRFKSMELKDSLFQNQNYASIRDLHLQYEISEYEENLRQETAKRKKFLHLTIFLLIGGAVLSVLILMVVKQNRRLREALATIYERNRTEEDCRIEKQKNHALQPFAEGNTGGGNQGESRVGTPVPTGTESGKEQPLAGRVLLDREVTDEIKGKILRALNNVELITQQEYTVKKFAEEIGVKEKYVSLVINSCFNKNFNGLLNEYRIREAKRILDSSDSHKYTLEALSAGLGFKSRSNFVSVFKRETGLTPSEYRKISQNIQQI